MTTTALVGLGIAYVVLGCYLVHRLCRRGNRASGPWQRVSYMQKHRREHEHSIGHQIGDGTIRR